MSTTHLSNVFKYISHFRLGGHQIGRKVGDMLELLTIGAIFKDDDLRIRLHTEPRVMGFSNAGHKIEFVILNNPHQDKNTNITGGVISHPNKILSFIECKKVGVEQTVNSTFKSNFSKYDNKNFRIPQNSEFEIKFAPRGLRAVVYKVVFGSNSNLIVKSKNGDKLFSEKILEGHRLIFTYGINGESEIIQNNGSLRGINYDLRNCKILEITSLTDDAYIGVLNDCLAGPQTPEKAKQASFVALDIRKKYSGSFDKQDNQLGCVSILIMTEFSHWEEKSQNMINACIDINMIVSDDIIVNAFEQFEERFGIENFLDRISKDAFLNDQNVQTLILEILDKYKNKIFNSIDDNTKKSLNFNDGCIRFIP